MAVYRRRPRIRLVPLTVGLLLVVALFGGLGFLMSEDRFPGVVLNTARLDSHIKYLSSLSLEGRAVGTEGEISAVQYIRGVLDTIGFKTTVQTVPLQGVTLPAVNLSIGSDNLRRGQDFVITSEAENVNIVELKDERILYGGYCIKTDGNPEDYDNFCSSDVRGRVVLCLVNDPFEGPLTYYGRWVYKVEELRRRGAAGVLLVHTTESAGYGWNVLQSPDGGENIRLMSKDGEKGLKIRAWIAQHVAERILKTSIDRAFEEANTGGLCMQETDMVLHVRLDITTRELYGLNVVGQLDGSARNNEHVIVTSHHDHLGAIERNGEKVIYPGAVDNASGVGKLLELATYFAAMKSQARCCKRTLVVITPTAEESVLLGSSYYADHPQLPLAQCAAVLNMDGMNIWGPTTDSVGIGSERSTLGDILARAAREEGQRVAPDPAPEQGLFFRSDQLPFARKGVPAMKITHGFSFTNHEQDIDEYLNATVWDYNRNVYHQVSRNVAKEH
mmetsp:Transcript_8713/g.38794  ORF Transcript_8713/g.38794 Transcript_8713/m.38794 type:complete len:502 (+) Transcript_8713:314-1819(+)